jgi:hypothetical protein
MFEDIFGKFDKKAFWEAIKLPLRLFLFAVVGFVIDYLIVYFSGVETQMGKILFVLLTTIDKYLHESAKNDPAKVRNDGYLGVKGLSGF